MTDTIDADAAQVPLDEMTTPAQVQAARAHLEDLWGKVHRGTIWARIGLGDHSGIPDYDDDKQQQCLAEHRHLGAVRLHAFVFLQKLRPRGPWVLTAIEPDTGGIKTITAQDWKAVDAFISKHNGKRNLYYSVNPTRMLMGKKPKKTDHDAIEYGLADLDPKEDETAEAAKTRYLNKLKDFEPYPTAAVDSGNGIQCLWRQAKRINLGVPVKGEFEPAEATRVKAFEARFKALMLRLGSKAGTENIDRILRLPGTMNLPNAAKRKVGRVACPAKLLWFNDKSYLLDAFPYSKDETPDENPFQHIAPKSRAQELNDAAMANLAAWVPEIFPTARTYQKGFRVSSSDLGRELEEDLSILPSGIKDFGVHDLGDPLDGKRTPIDIVMEHVFEVPIEEIATRASTEEYQQACEWLRERVVGEKEKKKEEKEATPQAKIKPVDLWAHARVPELPKGLLPAAIEEFAFTQGKLMGADPAGLAMGALTVCAAAIPDSVMLVPKVHDTGWKESTRMWCALVGGVSTKKSPIMSKVTRPIEDADKELRRKYAQQVAAFEALSPEERKERDKPTLERVRIEDITIEAAQEVLKDNTDGVLMARDELSGWFGSMDKYVGHRGSALDRSFWLQSYNGGSYTPDRIGRGSGYIEHLSISLLGGIQTDSVRKIAADGIDDGLMQRLNPVMLRNGVLGSEDKPPNTVNAYKGLVDRLLGLRRNLFYNEVQLNEDARKVRRQLEEKHIKLAQGYERFNKRLAAHVGKFDGMFARMCLLWHIIEHHQDVWPSNIDGDTAERVAKFMHTFMLPHAIAFYRNTYGLSDDHERLVAVAGYILAHELAEICNRDIQRGVRTMRGIDRRDIESICDQLDALGWVTRVPGKKLNDPPKWSVNPVVHTQFKEYAELEREERQQAQELMFASLSEHEESEVKVAEHPSGWVLMAFPGKLEVPMLQLKLTRPGSVATRLGERKRFWLKMNTNTHELTWGRHKAEAAIEDWVFDVTQSWKE